MAQFPPSNSVQTVSDEELILRRNQILQDAQNPKVTMGQQLATVVPALAASGAAFFGMHKLNGYLKNSNKVTSGMGKFGLAAAKFVVAGIAGLATFAHMFVGIVRQRAEKAGAAFDETNTEIGRRTGKTSEELGMEPITAADMQRMKEAHQSGLTTSSHAERTAPQPNQPQQLAM